MIGLFVVVSNIKRFSSDVLKFLKLIDVFENNVVVIYVESNINVFINI